MIPDNNKDENVSSKISLDDILIFVSIFVSSYVFFKQPFEGYLHYIIFIFYLPFLISKFGPPRLALKFIFIPLVLGIYNVIVSNCETFDFIKVTGGLFLSLMFYYYVLMYYKFNFKKLFNLYIKGIVLCCYIGVLQVISFRLGFKAGYNFNYIFNKWSFVLDDRFGIRVGSIFPEPSQFALLLLPACFIALRGILIRDFQLLSLWKSILILLSLILTTSSTGYIGLAFSLLILIIQYRRFADFLIVGVIIIISVFFLYTYVDDFKTRINASYNLWIANNPTIDDINSSSFVQFNNFQIAKSSFLNHPLIGTGLGSYPIAFERYSLTKEDDFLIKEGFEFNTKDGNSLLLRTAVETGIIGLMFFAFFIFKGFVLKSNQDESDVTWVYSSALLIIILGYLLRQGNYFINGFPFFCLMYYLLGVKHKNGEVALYRDNRGLIDS